MRNVIALLIVFLAVSGHGQERPVSTDGSFSLNLQTSSFDAPLFSADYSSSLSLFFTQRLRGGELFTLSGYQSHPSPVTYLTAEMSEIDFWGGVGVVRAGDIGTEVLLPPRMSLSGLNEGGARLRGIGGSWKARDREGSVTIGQERFAIHLADRPETKRATIFDASWLQQFGRSHVGAGLLLADDATFLSGSSDERRASLLHGTYIRELRPYIHVYGNLMTDEEGELAGKIGAGGKFQNGHLNVFAFSFDESLPLLYPLIRPGERGFEMSGDYDLSDLSRVAGDITWLEENPLSPGTSFRSGLSYLRSFGADRPMIALRWDHNELLYDLLGKEEVIRFGNRYSIEARKHGRVNSWSAVARHSEDDRGDRSELYGSFGKLLRSDDRLEGFAVVQRDESDDYGFVGETILERQWRGSYSYRIGIGGSYIASDDERGEGAVILGIGRQNRTSGWNGELDVTIPFDVGLPRADRFGRRLRLSLGTRYDWEDIREIRALIAPILDRNAFGEIAGRIIADDGEPIEAAAILINGEQRGRSGTDGRFRISRVPVGEALVTVDPLSVDPSLFVGDAAAKSVLVAPRESVDVELVLQRAVAFFGSIVRCVDGEIVPLANVEFALISDQQAYTIETTNTGSFALDSVTPGIYQIIINPTEDLPAELIPELTIDLTSDVLGYVIRIGCE